MYDGTSFIYTKKCVAWMGTAPLPFETLPFSPFFILMNNTWQRSNLTIRKTPTHNLSIFLIFFPSPLLFSLQIAAITWAWETHQWKLYQHKIPKEIKSSKSNPVPLSSLDLSPRRIRIKKKKKIAAKTTFQIYE